MTIQRAPKASVPVLATLSRTALVCLLGAGLATAAQAQGLKPSLQLSPGSLQRSPAALAPPKVQSADFIVAVVNSEPVTNHEVRLRLAGAEQQLAQQGGEMPSRAVLTREVLERLINERAQLQLARETGLRADDAAVDLAEQNLARRNQVDVTELRRRLSQEGMNIERFRDDLRQQVLLSRLREREVETRVRVSEQDVDQFLADERNNTDPVRLIVNLAQILVAVPDAANPQQVAALEARARRVLERARLGDDFVALVQEYSDAPERTVGGVMGMRPADRYPGLFIDATRDLGVGAVSAVVRSGAGFHVLKVMEKEQAGMPGTTVTQSRARHILLRTTAQLSEEAAIGKLAAFRRDVQAGRADFAALARDNSQDGSASQGGDLGWVNPGSFVPEFEAVMNGLGPGEIAAPMVSRFGVHLIQLMERREAKLSPAEEREMARGVLREKKLDEAYVNWAREVRGRAYVELRDPPE
jgi:peptidyl-prolyl cis-trans isomerase SurA